MVKVLRESNELKQTPVDCIKGATLLSVEEVENLLAEDEKECMYKGEHCWWWLRSEGINQSRASIVLDSGYVEEDGDYVDISTACVRPALILIPNRTDIRVGDVFEFGGFNFKIISSEYALCEEAIGECKFRKDYRAEDANVYEKSDIKKYVDDWFMYGMQDEIRIKERKNAGPVIDDEADWGFD